MKILNIFKKHPKKLIFLVIFSIIQYLNFTGFCYSERRYLSEEELLRRGAGKIYEENPDCCYIYNDYEGKSQSYNVDYFVNNLFGNHLFGLVYVSKREISPYDHDYPPTPYKKGWGSITACGVGDEDYAENITEKEYKKFIESVKQDR